MCGSGAQVWESPNILPREAWLGRAWSDLAARDPIATPVLLSRFQEETLWRRAIGDASALLDLTATASAAARAWDLLHAWKLPFDQLAFAETKEMLGGILLLETRDLQHAIALMSKHPAVKMGNIFEIRPANEVVNRLVAERSAAVAKKV